VTDLVSGSSRVSGLRRSGRLRPKETETGDLKIITYLQWQAKEKVATERGSSFHLGALAQRVQRTQAQNTLVPEKKHNNKNTKRNKEYLRGKTRKKNTKKNYHELTHQKDTYT